MSTTGSNTMVNDPQNPDFITEDHSLAEIKNDIMLQIRSGDDFPVTSAAVGIIGQLTCGQDVPVAELANAVLGDYGLTSKLLRLINSVYYLRFGEVTTISRAIILLGTDHLRDIALSVTLFDRLQVGASQEMIDVLCRAVYAAVMGRGMASATSHVNPEEAFICSLFHTLGEMLTAYYAPRTYAALSSTSGHADEPARTRASLLYLSLGKEIAQGWRFPARIVHSMDRPIIDAKQEDDIYRLCCISSGANDIARIMEEDLEPDKKREKIKSVLKTMHLPSLFVRSDGDETGPVTVEDVQKYCSLYGIAYHQSTIAQSLSEKSGNPQDTADTADETMGTVGHDTEQLDPSPEGAPLSRVDMAPEPPEPQDDPETVFVRGLHEVGDAFLEDCPLDDILTIIIETVFRGLKPFGLLRTLLLIRDTHRPVMEVRLALGDSLGHLKSWFAIPVATGSLDLFNTALSEQKNVFVNDTGAENGRQLIPDWLSAHVDGPVAIGVLPLYIKKITIGIIYLEGRQNLFKNLPQNYLNYLKLLHQQAVLALRQRN
jgi:eukaryotic-like serine/threonine-protein kinase